MHTVSIFPFYYLNDPLKERYFLTMLLHFKEHFGIPKTTDVDFVDIPLDVDLEAFLCPFLIANSRQYPFSDRVFRQMITFLKTLNHQFIVPNDRTNGIPFLDNLHEPNEYHLGYSPSNKGKGIAPTRAEAIFNALRGNRFTKVGHGVTNEAHNVLLLVKGIGQDIMSDTIANVCRDAFAEFTTQQCRIHAIATTSFKFHFFDVASATWKDKLFDLPEYKGKPVILIPKHLPSGSRSYPNHYNWFIAGTYISPAVLTGKKQIVGPTKGVRELKDGTKKANVRELNKLFSKPKEKLVDFVLEYSGSLDEFLKHAKERYPGLFDNPDAN